jgi:hypothetical protein
VGAGHGAKGLAPLFVPTFAGRKDKRVFFPGGHPTKGECRPQETVVFESEGRKDQASGGFSLHRQG